MSFILLFVLLALFFLEVIAFIWSLITKNNGYADVVWGVGFALVALISYIGTDADSGRSALITGLVCIWATRLSIRIFLKNKGRPEDFRYANWREAWGRTFLIRSFFQIYILQGALSFFIVLPVFLTNVYGGGSLGVLDYIGVLIWSGGFFFETVSDYQLDKFVSDKNNRGHILAYGLWKYSRHPNYFGEILMWVGISIIALSAPYGFLGLISPILIAFLIIKVSGIPTLERKWEGNPAYDEYKRETSALIPRFPKIS